MFFCFTLPMLSFPGRGRPTFWTLLRHLSLWGGGRFFGCLMLFLSLLPFICIPRSFALFLFLYISWWWWNFISQACSIPFYLLYPCCKDVRWVLRFKPVLDNMVNCNAQISYLTSNSLILISNASIYEQKIIIYYFILRRKHLWRHSILELQKSNVPFYILPLLTTSNALHNNSRQLPVETCSQVHIHKCRCSQEDTASRL